MGISRQIFQIENSISFDAHEKLVKNKFFSGVKIAWVIAKSQKYTNYTRTERQGALFMDEKREYILRIVWIFVQKWR